MNSEILIPILLIIGCIILIIILKNPFEQFKSEYRESEIFLKNPLPTFISNLNNKKDLIISNEDNNNNFPIKNIEINAPVIKSYTPKPDEVYKDVNFDKIRDTGVDIKMSQDATKNDNEYKGVIDSILTFSNPKDSGDFLTNVNIKDIIKNNNSTIADMFNKSTATVVNNITEYQLKSIQGNPIQNDNIYNLYKPELILMDKNLDTSNINNDITYKYSAFNKIPTGSLI